MITVDDLVTVPNADDMDDEIFQKHFNARHLPDIRLEGNIRIDDRNLAAFRAYHERIHALGLGNFDHEHARE